MLSTIVTPGSGEVVGVGLPIMVQFTAPVQNRAAVERRLKVTTSVPVVGAWHWFSAEEVHWRPRTYWPADTRVNVDFGLAGVDAGGGVWGDHDRTVTFSTGASMVSTVDVHADEMNVTARRARRPRHPHHHGEGGLPDARRHQGHPDQGAVPRHGLHDRRHPREQPGLVPPEGGVRDAAHLDGGVPATRRPWSVRHQGHENVSHGCTG